MCPDNKRLVSQSNSIQSGTIHTKFLLGTTEAVCLLLHVAMAHANCITSRSYFVTIFVYVVIIMMLTIIAHTREIK